MTIKAEACTSMSRAITLTLIGVCLTFAPLNSAMAQTYQAIHNFAGGSDGAYPWAGLTADQAGNLYGTTFAGGGGPCVNDYGQSGCGTVFRLTKGASGWVLNVLYAFQGGNDGALPQGGSLTVAADGHVYGTTGVGGGGPCSSYGVNGCGTVFSLTPASGYPWTETVLYRFTGGEDAFPTGGLIFDQAGNLYGTANGYPNSGQVFELSPSGGSWVFSVIHQFSRSQNEGALPNGQLVFDTSGNLYGATFVSDGGYDGGIVFQLVPSGSSWIENVLYDFPSQDGPDGGLLYAGVILDSSGNLYGATSAGGSGGGGTVFQLTPSGGGWNFSVLYKFAGTSECGPHGDLLMDSAGNLYGATACDGAYGEGSVFKLAPSNGGWAETELHDFTGAGDGGYPFGNLVMDASGNLYGTTYNGGANGEGTVFEISNLNGVPIASLSPSSLTFGQQDVGATSAPQAVTLSNTGTAPLAISSITTSGDFAQTSNCGGSLAAGTSCTINVTFTPTQIGTRNGTLTVTDNSNGVPGSQQAVSLTGTGINPGGSVSPTSLSFGNQVINTTGAAKKVTLTSTGTTNLMNISVTITGTNAGDFTQTNNCSASMAPGGKCTINVAFTPSIVGAESGTLDVNDNAANSPQTVALSGTGIPPVTLLPTSANFGNVAENDPSAAKNFTFTNNQAVTLNISGIATSNPDFAQTNTCGSSLAAKTHCTITVTFTPSILGAETGTLSVTDDASNSPQTSSLSGTGIVPATLTPATANFGTVAQATPSAPKNFTLSNKATVALNISSITTGNPDFSQTNTCGSSLAAKSNCTITVTFTPSIIGAETGTLTVTDSASNSPQTALLSGTGIAQATVSPASLTFAAQKVGTTSAAKNVTLKNNLLTSLAVSGFTFSGTNSGDFAVSSTTCGASLPSKTACTISVVFKPTAIGTRTATMNVNDSANNSPQTVSLTGTGK